MFRKLILPVFGLMAAVVGLSACGNGASVMSAGDMPSAGAGKFEFQVEPEEYQSDKWQAAARAGVVTECRPLVFPDNTPKLGRCDANSKNGAKAGQCIDNSCSFGSYMAGEACETDADCPGGPCATSNADCVDLNSPDGECLGIPWICTADCTACDRACEVGMATICGECENAGCFKPTSTRRTSGSLRLR